MLKLERHSDEGRTTVRLIGWVRSEYLDEITNQMGSRGPNVTLDLKEVMAVDLEVVRFLGVCEREGTELRHCPPYIRGWVSREQRLLEENNLLTKEKSMSKSTSNFPSKGIALITGASTGIGAIYADRLAKRGYDLILVARNEARLKSLSERLTSETGRSVNVLRADLNNKAELATVESILRDDPRIAILINNAGVGSVAPLLEADIEEMEGLIALNITALTRLTYAAAPRFVARGAGTIINVASIVGVIPERLNGVYGASKAYVLALGHSLQHELASKGVRIQAVLPGAVATDFWEIAGKPYQNLPSSIVMSPQDVVDAALAGLDQGELVTIPPLQDGDEWTRFEAARRALSEKFGNSVPAPRYAIRMQQPA